MNSKLTGCVTFLDIKVRNIKIESNYSLCEDSFNFIKLRQEASSRSYFRVSTEDASYILSVNKKNSEQAHSFLWLNLIDRKGDQKNLKKIIYILKD